MWRVLSFITSLVCVAAFVLYILKLRDERGYEEGYVYGDSLYQDNYEGTQKKTIPESSLKSENDQLETTSDHVHSSMVH
ncbi:MAG: hypothetical protein ACI86H_000623 [bacterium]|jgi:hypothetical protein